MKTACWVVWSAHSMYSAPGVTTCWFTPPPTAAYILSDQCRVFHRPLSTGSGRARHLAHGLRGHGEEDRGQPHSHRTILLPPQPHRPGLGALGAGEGHGDLPAAWCLVISDEIWSDIIRPGQKHIPTQMVNSYAKEHTVALYAPSKTFNLAGLIGSYHIIYSKWLRDRVDKESPCATTTR